MPPVKLLQAHMRGAGEHDPRFAFADGSAAYTTQDRHAVLVFPEAVLVSGLVAGDAAAIVSALRAPTGRIRDAMAASLAALGSEAKVEPAPGLHFMVCAHSRRDKRCGDNGTSVIAWLRKWRADYLRDSAAKRSTWHQPAAATGRAGRAGRGGWGSAASARAEEASVPVPPATHPVKQPSGAAGGSSDRFYRVAAREAIHVWPVSHVGMHRMAANVLVNPPGDWFAHMHEEHDARALFDHAVELGLAAIPPDADSLHPLRTSHRGSLGPMGLVGVAWDAADGDDSGADAPVDGAEADRRAGIWTDSLYSGTPVAEMVRPVARWWRGRMGLSKQEQQRVYLEIDPTADLGHAKLSAKLMGGSDRH